MEKIGEGSKKVVEKITVYGRTACETIILPTISDQRYSFKLDRYHYGLKEDILIEMQVMDGAWCFAENRKYSILKQKELFFFRKIYPGDILKFKTDGAEEVLFVMEGKDPYLHIYRKYLLNKKQPVTLGRGKENTFILGGSTLISKTHIQLLYEKDGWTLYDKSSNGTYINGKAVKVRQPLKFGDQIEIFGCRFVYLKEILAVQNEEERVRLSPGTLQEADQESMKWITMLPVLTEEEESESEIRPAPREQADYDTEEFEIEAPPAPKQQKEKSLFMTLGPSVTMALPMLLGVVVTGIGLVAVGLITMVGSAVIGAFWAYMNRKNQAREACREEEERSRKYSEYLKKKEDDLKKSYHFNKEQLCKLYPSAADCAKYDKNSVGLWNRNDSQEDFLMVRLGLGETNLQKVIRIPQERFTLLDDCLAEEPARIAETYATLKQVPVGVNLEEHPLAGIIGGKGKHGGYKILQILIAQIAANISYSDVKIVFLCDGSVPEEKSLLEQIKWLPHLWNNEKSFRYAGDTKESIHEALNALQTEIQDRTIQDGQSDERKTESVRYIVIATDSRLLEGNLEEVYIRNKNRISGVSLVLCAEEFAQLPNACEFMIENTEEFQGMYSVRDARKNWKNIAFDRITREELNGLSHRLAAIRVNTSEGIRDIPDTLTFLEMYGAESVEDLRIEQRWNSSRSYTSMAVPVGMRSAGRSCLLDIHENAHGPHGLVAGMTGSGKSEMLLTWILSLAVNFSPEDVSFFLVDFKGGGMASHVEKLPHVSGVITNLTENQIHRALVSIKSEMETRQSRFVRAGANDIYEYTRMYKNHEVKEPMAHLMIVVDEFAELKKEYPEFMNELISVAAVGRSLGVHLVLATQKPAGTVDEKIQSNTRFRICLQVQDRQDSKDMLEHYDAAYIRQKGRGYFRVGNDEIYEQFQSAWSRAPYSADMTDTQENLAKLYTVNGRTEIVGNYQKMQRLEVQRKEWVKSLIICAEEVLKRTQVTARKYLANAEVMQQVNDEMYRCFEEHEWNIEKSEYNDCRILDFFAVYDACEKVSIGEVTAEQMLQTAALMRRNFVESGKKTQLRAVVEEVCKTAEKLGQLNPDRLWLPELPTHLYFKDLQKGYSGEDSLEAWIGKYDDPSRQCQGSVSLDLMNQGNYLICGSVASGKSILLQTAVYSLITSYSAERLNLYILDFSSRMLEAFEQAPQVGGILYEQTMDRIGKFFYLMKQILKERKELLHGGTYGQYLQTGEKNLPAVVIVIDQYGSFREKTDGIYDSQMLELAKEGNANGIFMILSVSGMTGGEIPQKLADQLKGRVCLSVNDRYLYREVLHASKVDTFPENGIKGRGMVLRQGEALEYQTALALASGNDYERMDHIRKICRDMKENWKGSCARKIPQIPENPTYQGFRTEEEVELLLKDDRSLPLGYDMESARPWALDLSRFFCWIVSGRKRSGKTNLLQLVVRMATEKGGKVYVFAEKNSILEKTADETGASFYAPEDDYVPFCMEIKPELVKRNRKKHELECAGYSDEEIYEQMKEEGNIFIVIDDLAAFTEKLYQPAEGRTSVSGFFETFTDKGWYHQIFLFAGLNQDDRFSVQGRAFYENVTRDRNGVHLGGNAGSQQLLNFDYLSSFREQNHTEPLGVGLLAVGEGRMKTGKVVIPNARKQGG